MEPEAQLLGIIAMPIVAHSACRNLNDYAPAYHWRIRPTLVPSGVSVPFDFNLLCRSSAIPKREANQMAEITVHAKKRRLPGIEHAAGSLTLTCTELVSNDIRKMVQQFREKNSTNEVGAADTFKNSRSNWELIQMDRQGNDIVSYQLIECFVEDEDPGTELTDGEATAYMTDYQITLSYSHHTRVFLH